MLNNVDAAELCGACEQGNDAGVGMELWWGMDLAGPCGFRVVMSIVVVVVDGYLRV